MEIGRRMGAKRGNFTEAIIEAIDMWLAEGKAKENDRRRNRGYEYTK